MATIEETEQNLAQQRQQIEQARQQAEQERQRLVEASAKELRKQSLKGRATRKESIRSVEGQREQIEASAKEFEAQAKPIEEQIVQAKQQQRDYDYAIEQINRALQGQRQSWYNEDSAKKIYDEIVKSDPALQESIEAGQSAGFEARTGYTTSRELMERTQTITPPKITGIMSQAKVIPRIENPFIGEQAKKTSNILGLDTTIQSKRVDPFIASQLPSKGTYIPELGAFGSISATGLKGTMELAQPNIKEKITIESAQVKGEIPLEVSAAGRVPGQYAGTFLSKTLSDEQFNRLTKGNFIQNLGTFANPKFQYEVSKYNVQLKKDIEQASRVESKLESTKKELLSSGLSKEELSSGTITTELTPKQSELLSKYNVYVNQYNEIPGVKSQGATTYQRLANTNISTKGKMGLAALGKVSEVIGYFNPVTRVTLGTTSIGEGLGVIEQARTPMQILQGAGQVAMGSLVTFAGATKAGTSLFTKAASTGQKLAKAGLVTGLSTGIGALEFRSAFKETGSLPVATGAAIGSAGTILIGSYAPEIVSVSSKAIQKVTPLIKEFAKEVESSQFIRSKSAQARPRRNQVLEFAEGRLEPPNPDKIRKAVEGANPDDLKKIIKKGLEEIKKNPTLTPEEKLQAGIKWTNDVVEINTGKRPIVGSVDGKIILKEKPAVVTAKPIKKTEFIKVYHATSDKNLPSILEKGLQPASKTKISSSATGELRDFVSVGTSKDVLGFGTRTAIKTGGKPVVIEAKIPKREFEKLVVRSDKLSGLSQELRLKEIPAKYIKSPKIETPKTIVQSVRESDLGSLRLSKVREESKFFEPSMEVKTTKATIVEPNLAFATRNDFQTKTGLDVRTTTKTDTKVKTDTLSGLKTLLKTDTRVKTDLKTDTLTNLATTLKTATPQKTGLRERMKDVFRRPTKQLKQKPKIREGYYGFDTKLFKGKTKIAQPSEDSFEAFVLNRGKEVDIGKTKTKEEAERLLKRTLSGTLRASGGIKFGGEKLTSNRINLGFGFAPSKTNQFRIVEEKSRRLKRGTQEVSEIQAFKRGKSIVLSNL